MIDILTFKETGYNLETDEEFLIAEWTLKTYPNANYIIFQRIAPDTKHGDKIKKVVKIVDGLFYGYQLQKTQIKANGGAAGLMEFISKHLDFAKCWTIEICNHAFFKCKEYNF